MTTTDFKAIPVLDMARLVTDRAGFLSELQNALVHVGFFYVVNHGVPLALLDSTTAKAHEFFDLSLADKLAADKIHSPTFLGYSTQGNEITKNKKDNREQFDFANELAEFWRPGQPEYERLTGPNVWPAEEAIPGFRDAILTYHAEAQGLAERLTDLVSEALGLDPKTLAEKYVDPTQQHRAKLIKYPAVDKLAPGDGNQGVGAHRDTSNLLTVLYQADLPGLQVQNHAGDWVDAPVIPGSFVINIGTGLEYLVDNVAVATTHRVLNPPPGRGPRYSIAYFHGTRLDRKHYPTEMPPAVLAQKPQEVVTDTAGFQFAKLYAEDPGLYAVVNRCSSHRDVAVKWYPELCKAHGIKAEDGNTGY